MEEQQPLPKFKVGQKLTARRDIHFYFKGDSVINAYFGNRPYKCEVKRISDYNSNQKCYEIIVEWELIPGKERIGYYMLLETEFIEHRYSNHSLNIPDLDDSAPLFKRIVLTPNKVK